MSIRKQLFSLAIIVFVLSLSGAAWAGSHARIVRLSFIEGDGVEMDRGDGRGFDKAFLNMPVIHGARVWTRNNSLAEIEFEDGSTIRMTPGTIISFQDLSLLNNGERQTVAEVNQGTAYFNINKRDASGFRVMFDRQEVSPTRATAHFRLLVDKNESILAVFNGKVRVSNSTPAQVEVGKGESIRLEPADYGRYFLARGVDDDHYDTWDKDRQQDRDAYNARATYASNLPYYGQADLGRYGSYFSDPAYGTLWRPYYLGASWDPFMDGSWVYYPGYGYTWVSPYAWGWTPYRYGSWVFVPAYGWCWQPGGYNQFAGLPVVINPPYHHIRPVPPSPGAGSPVVIVGGGPQAILPGSPLAGPAARVADSADIRGRTPMENGKHRPGTITEDDLRGRSLNQKVGTSGATTLSPTITPPPATYGGGSSPAAPSNASGDSIRVRDTMDDTRDRAIVASPRGYQPPVQNREGRGRERSMDDVQQRTVGSQKAGNTSAAPAPRTYSPPAQTYNPPARAYTPPAQTYNPPAQTYTPPAQTYTPPARSYSPPERTYSPPPQTSSPPPAQTAPKAARQSDQ